MKNDTYLEVAVAIVREAGEILLSGIGQQKSVEHKSSMVDLVTQQDHLAEALIVERLRELFPDHGIVAEEGSNKDGGSSPYRWYIDPIDGTNNYAHGFPFFAVSLALYEGDEPQIGVVYDPVRNECFTAIAGGGAMLVNGHESAVIRVSHADTLLSSLVATGYPYDRHTSDLDNIAQTALFLKKAQGLRRAGSAALDMAYVAAGRLDGYWEFKLKSWDIAASRLLVEEAGGVVTTVYGSPMEMHPQVSLIASNGRIHQEMVDLLAPTLVKGGGDD